MKTRVIGALAVLLSLFVNGLTAAGAYAEHETRGETLQQTGVNILLVGLVLGAAVLALGLFAIIILWWEQRDEKAEKRAGQ